MSFADRYKTFVGVNQRVDGVERYGPDAYIRLAIPDIDKDVRTINLQVGDARLLSKSLTKMANLADPPKPRKRRKT